MKKAKDPIKQMTLTAVLTAMTVAMSLLVIIPVPATKGFVTLCEVGIYATAILFGNPMGAVVGGTSGFLIDLLSGHPEWCLFSLVIHGAQGAAVGFLTPEHKTIKTTIFPLLVGSVIMIVGYYFATALLFGLAAGLASIFGNIVQVGFGMVVTLSIVESLVKFKPNLV